MFERQKYGADVATIVENDERILEVLRRKDGLFDLTIHSRIWDGEWEDLTVTLNAVHFIDLGRVADNTLCIERDCPEFGTSPPDHCKCHPRYFERSR